jgi:hypothetical protein
MNGNCNGYDCANRSDYCRDSGRPCSVLRASRNGSLLKAGSLVAPLGFIGALLSFLAKPFLGEESPFLVIAALCDILTDLRYAFGFKRLELFFLVEHDENPSPASIGVNWGIGARNREPICVLTPKFLAASTQFSKRCWNKTHLLTYHVHQAFYCVF